MMANLKLKREINVGSVRVHGNCMEFGNTAVQLSNISSLSTSEVKGSPRKGVIILLVGFASLFVHWLLGAAIILVGVFIFFCRAAKRRIYPIYLNKCWWEFFNRIWKRLFFEQGARYSY